MSKPMLPSRGGNFEPIPPGKYAAILYQIAATGPVKSTYQGRESVRDMIHLSFEVPSAPKVKNKEGKEAPRAFFLSGSFTVGERSKYYAMLRDWFSMTQDQAAKFDVRELIGYPVWITLSVNPETQKNVAVLWEQMPEHEGKDIPTFNEKVVYFYKDHDEATFRKLPEWMQEEARVNVYHSGPTQPSQGAPDRNDAYRQGPNPFGPGAPLSQPPEANPFGAQAQTAQSEEANPFSAPNPAPPQPQEEDNDELPF